jgi:Flp pilus assembly protein TadD/SAM-dependent methyltransferase
MVMTTEWDRAFEDARRLHQAGQLDEALRHYQHVVSGNPSHGGAMHMMGVIAFQIGRTDTAVDLLGQAAVLEPLTGAVHSNHGLALMARGRRKEAEASFRRALLLSPQPQTHASLGQLLMEQGRLAEAEASFRAAIRHSPALPEALAGLGETLWKLGRPAEALTAYEQAARLEPSADTLANHALLLLASGDAGGALARIRQALAAQETPRARLVCVSILRLLRWERDDAEVRALLERALREGWTRPAVLLAPAADLVKLRLKDGERLESDALLQLMLVSAPNIDAELEHILTGLRRQLLAQPEGRDLGFSAALAQQCFINEYVFAEEEGERARAEALAHGIDTALAGDDVVLATALLAVACYMPLGALKHADRLLTRFWPDALEPVLRQQVQEPAEEKRLAAALPALTAIADATSLKVQAQYEENPYPRWVRMEAGEPPITLAAWLGRRFPLIDGAKLPLLPDMLFAGCGTGRFTLELARRHPASSQLGIDLSRASLGYAARKAQEENSSVRFAQADILRLPETGRRFSFIESSGVLHHMADPFQGWQALLECLLPGGVMRVSLYSALARAPVDRARAWIAGAGIAATPAGVRVARQRLLAERPDVARLLLNAADFYSVSACRDLLFHVEEHSQTLADIAAFLARNDLVFLGFEAGEDAIGAYRARFPADSAATDLGNWAAFETEHPGLFAGMYQFWIQKPEHRPRDVEDFAGRATNKT